MSSKRIKTRIIQKHATASDWAKAVNFVPLAGEVIVYDVDANYSYERIKIGDGSKNVNDLPFLMSVDSNELNAMLEEVLK